LAGAALLDKSTWHATKARAIPATLMPDQALKGLYNPLKNRNL